MAGGRGARRRLDEGGRPISRSAESVEEGLQDGAVQRPPEGGRAGGAARARAGRAGRASRVVVCRRCPRIPVRGAVETRCDRSCRVRSDPPASCGGGRYSRLLACNRTRAAGTRGAADRPAELAAPASSRGSGGAEAPAGPNRKRQFVGVSGEPIRRLEQPEGKPPRLHPVPRNIRDVESDSWLEA